MAIYRRDYTIEEKETQRYRQNQWCYVVPCGETFPLEYWSRKKVVEEHCLGCRVCNVLEGHSKQRKGFTQSEVATLFEHDYNCQSGTGALKSSNGILTHYSTIEAIKTLRGVIISNNECWSRGFAHCTKPNYMVAMDLTTILSMALVGPKEALKEIHIIATNGTATLLEWRKRYFLNAEDEGRFIVELVGPCKTLKEAYESMKPNAVRIAENLNNEVKRQGEYFFIPLPTLKTRDVSERERIITHKGLERDYYEEKDFVAFERLFPEVEESRHCVTEKATSLGKVVVRGTVRHPEHRMLKLGKTWHLVAKNTVKNSWSIGRGRD